MLTFARSLIYLIGQVISSVIICIAALAFSFSRPVRERIILFWAQFNIWTLDKVCGVRYQVTGSENLPNEPSVIVSNHQSAWETLCFQIIFPAQSYVLKRELLWIPFFGWGLALNSPIAIDRSKKVRALDQLVRQGMSRLADGRWLVIFPEGSRMKPGSPGNFQAGGAMIASKANANIVPVCHNAGIFWPKRSFLKFPGTIDVRIGKTIYVEGKKTRDLNSEVEAWIKNELGSLPQSQN